MTSDTGDHTAMALMTGRISATEARDQALSELASLEPSEAPPKAPGLVLTALAAGQPQAITPALADALLEIVQKANLRETWQPGLDEALTLLKLLSGHPAGSTLPESLAVIVRGNTLHPRWAARITALLAESLKWSGPHADIGSILEIAEHFPLDERRAFFHRIIGPHLLSNPGQLDDTEFRRAIGILDEPVIARHVVAALAEHQQTPALIREEAAELCQSWFPLRPAWRQIGADARHVLCVQNIADGQGDEIVRVAPLLEALLSSHPDMHATLITDRGYLYDHPRLETVGFDDQGRIAQVLETPPDILIEFFEPQIAHLNYDQELATRLETLRETSPPLLDIRAGKGWNWFVFQTVRLGEVDWASPLQLDRATHGSVYDPVTRLILELGLPLRIGEQASKSGPILASHVGANEAGWRSVGRQNAEGRPVALLNPFGGSLELKGFVSAKYDDLRRLLQQVVDEGFFVVICPTGTPWGSARQVDAILSTLPTAYQGQVAIGQDPDNTGDDTAESASNLIRRVLGLLAGADLIITVEGWMMHAAYHVGKPYRLLMLPYSEGVRWYPWGRSVGQQIWSFRGDSRLDEPPVPEQPRKLAWLQLLKRINDPAWLPLLVGWTRSPDVAIRAAAAHTLGQIRSPDAVPHLARLIQDSSHQVRSAAAGALLSAYPSHAGQAGIPPAEQLETFRLLDGVHNNWSSIEQRAGHNDPALLSALHDVDPVIRREAAVTIEHISRQAGASDPQQMSSG